MRMAVLGLAIVACSKPVKPLDCAWLSGMNCWKTMLQAAAACAPPKAESGSFDGRRKLCAYGGHALVSFTESVPVSPTQRQRWNFIVLSGGAACLKLEQPDERTSRLTTSAGSVTVSSAGNDEIVTCPDGTHYGANALSLLASCGEANLPGTFASGSGAVSFSLLGGASGEVQVFNCRQQ
jgi:hypothetical protein